MAFVGKTDPIERGLRPGLHHYLRLCLVGKTDPIERGLRPHITARVIIDPDVGKTDPIERGLRHVYYRIVVLKIRWKNRPDRKGIKTGSIVLTFLS